MSKYVHAQKLNRRVTFQRLVGGADSWGQPNTQWVDAFKLWAHVKSITGAGFVGQEFVAGEIEVSRATASVRVRKRPGITPDMRCLIGGVVHEIRVVLPDEQDQRFIDIGVASGANDG